MVRALTQTARGEGSSPSQSYILSTIVNLRCLLEIILLFIRFIYIGIYIELFFSFEKYTEWLERQQTDIVRNPNHRFLEKNISAIIGRMPCIGVGIWDHIKVHYQFHTMSLQSQQEILYPKEIFQSVHSRFLEALDHLQNHQASGDDIETTTPETPLVKTVWKEVLFPHKVSKWCLFLEEEVQLDIVILLLWK